MPKISQKGIAMPESPIRKLVPFAENAKKSGMLVHTFWILGYPGETYEEMQKTIDFAMRMRCGSSAVTQQILQGLLNTGLSKPYFL